MIDVHAAAAHVTFQYLNFSHHQIMAQDLSRINDYNFQFSPLPSNVFFTILFFHQTSSNTHTKYRLRQIEQKKTHEWLKLMIFLPFFLFFTASRIRYEITSGNIGGAFAVKNMTGAIYVAGALDYETRKRVSLAISCRFFFLLVETFDGWMSAQWDIQLFFRIFLLCFFWTTLNLN